MAVKYKMGLYFLRNTDVTLLHNSVTIMQYRGKMRDSDISELLIKMHQLSGRSVSFFGSEHHPLHPITCVPGFRYRNLSSPGC